MSKYHFNIEINEDLAEAQGVSEGQQNVIRALHCGLNYLFEHWETKGKIEEEDVDILNKQIEGFEFALQDAWNFERDATKHLLWLRNPLCKCPYMDNKDCFGIDRRYINGSCPMHGRIIKNGK